MALYSYYLLISGSIGYRAEYCFSLLELCQPILLLLFRDGEFVLDGNERTAIAHLEPDGERTRLPYEILLVRHRHDKASGHRVGTSRIHIHAVFLLCVFDEKPERLGSHLDALLEKIAQMQGRRRSLL